MEVQLDAGQQRFVDGVAEHSHPVVGRSVAGSGKTLALTRAYRQLLETQAQRDILVACFNKQNEKDLKSKLPEGANLQTYSSIAWWAVLRAFNCSKAVWTSKGTWDRKKYLNLINYFAMFYYGGEVGLTPEQYQIVEDTEALRVMCHNTMTNPLDWSAVSRLADDYCIPVDEEFARVCLPRVFEWGVKGIHDSSGNKAYYCGSNWSIKEKFDQSELLYLAATEPGARFWKYKTILTDEAQDRNKAQSHLLKRALAYRGICHSLGDPDQSLYFFMGSDTEGWDRLVNEPGAEIVDNSISYRCSRAVVELAQEYVHRIQPWSKARPGKIEYVKSENVYSMVQPGHVCVFRNNAPAIRHALRCISHGIRSYVRGRDIGYQLLSLLDTISAYKGYSFDSLMAVLQDWRNQQISILMKKYIDAEREVENIVDRALSMEALYTSALQRGINNDATFRLYIEDLFDENDDTSEVVLCSTIHKFKGLQAENIWIQEEDLMPGKKAVTQREIQQDLNAAYVAITRSQDSIYLVKDTGSYA